MKTIDTNILVYAHREEFANHRLAKELLESIVLSDNPWVLLWPCIYEFIRIITHPKLFHPPTPVNIGMKAINFLINSCTTVLGETEQHQKWFNRVISETKCKPGKYSTCSKLCLRNFPGNTDHPATTATTDRE